MDIVESNCRTIIIENISNDFDESLLTDIFAQAGIITKFKTIHDFESNRFRGICEYHHPSMASKAVKMFNNLTYNGLNLGVVLDSNISYDKTVSNDVPESVISQAVASLPPDQMYELMKQMKLCIQNNPNEARNMLMQNPQLAYALLQAQIVMKIVDPKVAIAMLNRSNEQIPNSEKSASQPIQMPSKHNLDNFRPIPTSTELVLSHESHNQVSNDLFRSMFKFQIPVFAKANDQRMTTNINSSLMQKNIKLEPTSQTSDFDSQKEKAALIMQVLKLSDHQIAMLPEDQRRSILILKEQLNR